MTDVVALLRAALGDAVVTDPAALEALRSDKSGQRTAAPPLALVAARTVEHVQAALRIAHELRVPVVPRGAGTGLSGGAMAGAGELVISTAAMTRILSIDEADQLAVVEPGVLNGALNRELAPRGLRWAPDPASREISTVGGNIATNAGGLLCAKYGVTREAVRALDVVLADGTLLSTGHRTVKGVTGLDLTALLIGSEGTLGIIVGATLALTPVPAGVVATIGVTFPSVEEAAAAAAAITAARIRPAVMEIIDPVALAAILRHLGMPDRAPGSAHLLVQTDGAAAEQEAADALAIIAAHGGDAAMTTDPEEGERLLAVRRAMHPAMEALGPVLIEDVAVPRSRLAEMFAAIRAIGERYSMPIPTVAHAGDGNLHPNLVYAGDEVPDVVWQAAGEVFEAALALGGTLTGEHGVGTLKRRWLAAELGDEQVALQRRIKEAFDPRGILSPGRAI
ncbi:FAD-binding oxidoreductase [Microcella frigidaquae]|uniref:Glycolate oxidase n=1 Tax=Microcella frigidaquae TaxID=424758 RepID=A0A840X308_9MICO|nr:FAD-linked oxidase C-terminal domain-containing protein [Microcella frigidaquae]MBB5616873.1 glycolate oxidase [Microcella frigidaquae]NHN43688.1 FAD-binding protein [Microcella frigidaquae]